MTAEAELTMVLTNWARPNQTHQIIAELKQQSVPINIFVWNNNPEIQFKNAHADMIVNCSQNLGMGYIPGLWQLSGTPFVAKMDDDLHFADNKVVEEALGVLKTQRSVTQLVGAFGVRIYSDSTYRDGHHISVTEGHGQYQSLGGTRKPKPDNLRADLLKGRFLLANARGAERLRSNCPHCHLDLYISTTLAGGRRLHHTLAGCFFNHSSEAGRLVDFPDDDKGHCSIEGHLEMRDRLTNLWASNCEHDARVKKKPLEG